MRLKENLFRRLTELRNLSFHTATFNRIFNGLNINGTFVCKGIEEVVRFDGIGALLFVAKDKVDPVMQVGRYIVTLERFTVEADEILGRGSPAGKNHITKWSEILLDTELQVFSVEKEVTSGHKEFRDEFFHISTTVGDILPALWNTMEHTIGGIELAVLQAKHELRRLANKIEENVARGAVVGTVEELGLSIGNLIIALLVGHQTSRVESTDGFAKITECARFAEVEAAAAVVRDHPRKYRILREVVEGASSQVVHVEEVIEVADEAILPLERHVALVVADEIHRFRLI